MDAIPALLKRDRLIIGLAIASTAIIAWGYTFYEARRMTNTGLCECAGMQMGGPDLASWSAGSLLPLFLMWAVMMVAMMLPSAAPMLLTFAAVARNRRQADRPYVPVTVFAGGYVVVWCVFSLVAAAGQWLLHREALLSPMMVSSSAWLAGMLLLAAGVFQFTPLKKSCLRRCRAPLDFILTRWREGSSGAFGMGIEHGAFCAGCCWALMALLFVLGVMNIIWIAALTIIVALEKLLPRAKWFSAASGTALFCWGIWVMAGGPRLGV
jgi:predicted metal-binding membrane protein